jgi:hypothetical protein
VVDVGSFEEIAVDVTWVPVRAAGVTETAVRVDGQEIIATPDTSTRLYAQGAEALASITLRGRSLQGDSGDPDHAERSVFIRAIPAPALNQRRVNNTVQDATTQQPASARTALQSRDGLSSEWSPVGPIASADSDERAYTDETLDPSTVYEYRVGVYNDHGALIGYSPTIVSAPAPEVTPHIRAYL